jgi:MurNAc alpha-1-phosphate uridylyltransferase
MRRRNPDEAAPYIYTGIQLLHPRLFTGCPSGIFSLNILYNKALQASPPRIKAVVHDGVLLNVGDSQGKQRAEEICRLM